MATTVTVAVEGKHDEPVARRILEHVGFEPRHVYVAGGKSKLDDRLQAYNRAAAIAPWFILRDLDHDAPCAPALIAAKLERPERRLCIRVAVRAIESWLIADAERISEFLAVARAVIPGSPDSEENPKVTLVNLARRSRQRGIREDMVPAEGTSAVVGAGYTGRIIEFASKHWRPSAAVKSSDSLARCIAALQAWTL